MRPVQLILLTYTLDFGLVYGANIFISRHVGSEAYGDFSATLSLATVLAAVALLGLEGELFQEIPVLEHEGRVAKARSRAGLGLALCALTSLLMSGLLWLGDLFVDSHPGHWALWVFPFMVLVKYMGKVMAGFEHALRSAFLTRVLLPGTILALLLWLCSRNQGLSGETAVLATGAGWALVGFILGLLLGPRHLRWNPATKSAHLMVQRALPFGAVGLLYICMDHAGVLLLEALNAPEHEVGLYAACVRIASVLLIFLSGVTLHSTTRFAVLSIQEDRSGLREELRNNLKVLLAASLATVLLVGLFGRSILSWFGDSFQDAYVPLVIVTVGFAIHTTMGFSTTLLQIAGQQKIVLTGAVVMILINLVLGSLLIPLYGALGGALAFMSACIIVYPVQATFVKSKLGVSYFRP